MPLKLDLAGYEVRKHIDQNADKENLLDDYPEEHMAQVFGLPTSGH